MNEKEALLEIEAYIAGTYGQHYAKDKKFQTTEIIFDLGHGEGFCVGNIIKYASLCNIIISHGDNQKRIVNVFYSKHDWRLARSFRR